MNFHSQTQRIASALTNKLRPTSQEFLFSAAARCTQRTNVYCFRGVFSSSTRPSGFASVNESLLCRFSTKPESSEQQSTAREDDPKPPQSSSNDDEATKDSSAEAGINGADANDEVMELESQIKELKDRLLRSLAEQENTRRIATRDVASAKSFAISSFAKSLLETSDNLSRALDAVPEEMRNDRVNHSVLANLYEGITMTNDGLNKAFAKNGLVKFGEKGEKFDPNRHQALFEYLDPEEEVGNIGQVTKVGFLLNERVIRPAEVGVVKSP